ncbi:alpha-amylase family protein [Nakamurella sp.]|uniref:alpha-amylase family protein n=1 Tax=Nakamurella sp. TaxID=1869182 RepID=UPI003784EDCA
MRTAPADMHAEAQAILQGRPRHQQELFGLRLDRWWQDLDDALTAVYGGERATDLERRLVRIAATAFGERDPELHRLDLQRTLDPAWFQDESMLGYACYTERFAGDLAALIDKIGYLRELGVTYLHLMPLLQPRDGDSDGGYAVADYRRVRTDLGTMADLRTLAAELRAAGISLVMDLVLNHVAAEHAWARAARDGDPHYRDYFYVYPDRTEPDRYERTLPEVFPDFAPGSFSHSADLDGWVWTTFNTWQWDVNWTNPDVFAEYADVILFLANQGVQVLRLDAIAFVWKRLGTNCQNQPEVHAITQALRAVARIACPAVLFKAEAIVAPQDLVHYLGQGAHHGKVSDIAYHNSLMVQIWSTLAAGDASLAAHALRAIPPVPTTTTWVTYVRCHDDIGWAIDAADAAAVGLNGFEHQRFLSDWYSGSFPGSPARGLVFQENPDTGDRRISGSAASLVGLDTAGSPADVDLVVGRLYLAHAIIMGWGGIPVIWMGDEIAMSNDPDWASEPGHESDNRWAHRPRMDWDRAAMRHDLTTVPGRVFAGLRHLAAARSALPHLEASVAAEIPALSDPGVLPVLRRHPLGPLLELFNVTGSWRAFPGSRLAEYGLVGARDALSGEQVFPGPDGNIWLHPYAVRWLVRD